MFEAQCRPHSPPAVRIRRPRSRPGVVSHCAHLNIHPSKTCNLFNEVQLLHFLGF